MRHWRTKFDAELIVNLPTSVVSVSDKYKCLDALGNAFVFEIVLARLMESVSVSQRFRMEAWAFGTRR